MQTKKSLGPQAFRPKENKKGIFLRGRTTDNDGGEKEEEEGAGETEVEWQEKGTADHSNRANGGEENEHLIEKQEYQAVEISKDRSMVIYGGKAKDSQEEEMRERKKLTKIGVNGPTLEAETEEANRNAEQNSHLRDTTGSRSLEVYDGETEEMFEETIGECSNQQCNNRNAALIRKEVQKVIEEGGQLEMNFKLNGEFLENELTKVLAGVERRFKVGRSSRFRWESTGRQFA